jgi:hypothetical protein
MLVIGLSCITFIILRFIPSIPCFFKAFIMKGYWISSKAFPASMRWSCDFCPSFCLCVVLFYWFACVEPSLHLWNEINLIRVYDLFNLLFYIVVNIFFCCLFWQYWSLNTGPCTCYVGTLLLETQPYSF